MEGGNGGTSRRTAWGKMGPTWGLTQSSIILFGHLTLLTGNTLACVFEREPSSLRRLCGKKEKENISGSMYHIPAQSLLPVSSFLLRLVVFSSYPYLAPYTQEGPEVPHPHNRSVSFMVVCGAHVWLVGWVKGLNLVEPEVGGGTSWLWLNW